MKQSRIAAPAREVFAFHERPDAFALLAPSYVRVIAPPRSLAVGTRVEVRVFGVRMVFEHVAYDPPRMFADRMIVGPLRTWLHHHVVIEDGDGAILSDEIECSLPAIARWQLERMFAQRHAITRRACERPTRAR